MTPVCVLGVAQSCNDEPAMSANAGTCRSGIAGLLCDCSAGFVLNVATGRCRAPTVVCKLTFQTGACFYRLADAGAAPTSGTCGSTTVGQGCQCSRLDGGAYQPLCGTPCSLDAGNTVGSEVCGTLNCGIVHCVSGTTCAADNWCN